MWYKHLPGSTHKNKPRIEGRQHNSLVTRTLPMTANSVIMHNSTSPVVSEVTGGETLSK